jgi:hypothetical protein
MPATQHGSFWFGLDAALVHFRLFNLASQLDAPLALPVLKKVAITECCSNFFRVKISAINRRNPPSISVPPFPASFSPPVFHANKAVVSPRL